MLLASDERVKGVGLAGEGLTKVGEGEGEREFSLFRFLLNATSSILL